MPTAGPCARQTGRTPPTPSTPSPSPKLARAYSRLPGAHTADALVLQRLQGSGLHFRRAVHGIDDALITGTAAEVAGQPFAYLLVFGLRIVSQQRSDRNDESRREDPSLK